MDGVQPTAIATGHTRQRRQSALDSVIFVWCVLLWLLVVLGTLQGEHQLAQFLAIILMELYLTLSVPNTKYNRPEEKYLAV